MNHKLWQGHQRFNAIDFSFLALYSADTRLNLVGCNYINP